MLSIVFVRPHARLLATLLFVLIAFCSGRLQCGYPDTDSERDIQDPCRPVRRRVGVRMLGGFRDHITRFCSLAARLADHAAFSAQEVVDNEHRRYLHLFGRWRRTAIVDGSHMRHTRVYGGAPGEGARKI